MTMKHNKSLQAFFDNQVVGMMEVDTEGQYLHINNHWCHMIGYSVEELITTNFRSLTHPDDLPRQLRLDKELAEGKKSSYRIEKRYIHKNGKHFWADLSVTGLYDNNGILTGMVGLAIDISKRKEAEIELLASETRFRTLIDHMEHIPVQGYDENRRVIYWNSASTAIYGYSRKEALGQKLEDLIIPPHMRDDVIQSVQLWLTQNQPIPSGEMTLCNKEGEDVPVYSSHLLHTTASGKKELFCIDIDLQLLHQAEAQAQKLVTAVEQVEENIIITDTTGIIEYVNPAFTAVTGYSRDEAIGQTPSILKSGKQDNAVYSDLWKSINQGKTWEGRLVNKKKNGSFFTEDTTISPIFNSSGTIINFVAAKRDITEQLLTEEKYRHSQKVEAIGQLAGGVAHDFNNMLAIILGQVEIALLKISPGDPLEKRLQEIKIAATRSSNLTQQLLGFARKQSHQPQILNLSDTVANMLTMLQRLIGENLELRWAAEAEFPFAEIDPGHFDQILTNLIINARDAIDATGVISVKTRQVFLDETFCQDHPGSHTGEYILLEISDTGCGMDRETLDKIFTPFFTTKGMGKGTGLGLPMVFGLVKQNNGYIEVNSTPGEGSTFSLYFPQVQVAEELPTQADKKILVQGTETILVVEDEASLLDITKTMLTEAGYKVLSAQGPFAAIQLAEKIKGSIHLLLTDIVMPKMNGVELSEHLLKIKPGIKVLYMSGYPKEHFRQLKQQDTTAQLLKKPFSTYKLTQMVRDALDGE